jgi:hypothetical protein
VDITYYDSGYIDPNYYVYTADAVMGLGTFIVEDYLEPDYFENTGIAVTLTCDVIKLTIVPASADLVANFSQSVNGVIDVRAEVTLSTIVSLSSQEIRLREFNSDCTSTLTQSTSASATFSPQLSFSSIASQLTAAFQNATGTITMETVVTVTAIVGVIKQFTNLLNVGIRTPSPYLGLSVTPVFGVDARSSNFTLSVWIRRDSVTGTPQPIVGTRGSYGSAFIFVGANIQTRFNYDADEPEAVWYNVAPSDGLWHHYVIKSVFPQPGFAVSHWRLWIDGVSIGQTGSNGYQAAGQMVWNDSYGGSAENDGLNLGHGIVANFNTYELVNRSLDGAMAQLWMGSITDAEFNITDFFDGYLDFGTNGTRNGLLPTPFIYIPFEPTYTDLGVGVTVIRDTPAWSGEYLKYTSTRAEATVTAEPQAVLLVVANLTAQSELTVTATKTVVTAVEVTVSASLEVAYTRERFVSADLSTASTLTADINVTRSDSASLTASSSLDCVNTRVRTTDVAITAESTLTATIGEITEFTASLESQFTQVTETSRTRIVSATAESAVTVTAQIDDRLRDQSAALTSTATVTVAVTRIPSISAALTSEFTLLGEAEKFVIGQGVLSVVFTQTTTAFKVVFAQAALVVEGFQLTQGDILNFDPCRDIKAEQETRIAKILAESRLFIVDSETRTLKVPQETRVLRVEYETRVNITQC